MIYSFVAILLLTVAAFVLGLMTSREHLNSIAVFIGEKLWEGAKTLLELLVLVYRWLIKGVCGLLMAVAMVAACVAVVLTLGVVLTVAIVLIIFWVMRRIRERIKPFLKAFVMILFLVIAAIWWLLALLLLSSQEAAHEVSNIDWLLVGALLLAVVALVALGLVLRRWLGAILAGLLMVAMLLIGAIISGVIGVVLGLALLALLIGLASLLAEGLGRVALLLGAVGLLIITLLKGCAGGAPETPAPPPQEKKEEVVAEVATPREDFEVRAIIWARPGDGCIRITRRGDHPLTLPECIALTKEYGRDALWFSGLIIAPMVGRHEVWHLIENRSTGERRWIPARRIMN